MDDLVKYRIESAKERLNSAKILLDAGQYRDSLGRSYYAIFSAVRSLLATKAVDYSKHAGVIAYFQKEYIKPGIFEVKYSKILQRAFQIRNASDYDDFFIATKNDAQEQYKNAADMVMAIETYINE